MPNFKKLHWLNYFIQNFLTLQHKTAGYSEHITKNQMIAGYSEHITKKTDGCQISNLATIVFLEHSWNRRWCKEESLLRGQRLGSIEQYPYWSSKSHLLIALCSRTSTNLDASSGLFAHPFSRTAHSFAGLAHRLRCAHSFACSLPH